MTQDLEPEECPDAYQNPKCPYVTMINQHSSDIHQIKNALIGEDLQDGLVADVQTLKTYFRITAAGLVIVVPIAVGHKHILSAFSFFQFFDVDH